MTTIKHLPDALELEADAMRGNVVRFPTSDELLAKLKAKRRAETLETILVHVEETAKLGVLVALSVGLPALIWIAVNFQPGLVLAVAGR